MSKRDSKRKQKLTKLTTKRVIRKLFHPTLVRELENTVRKLDVDKCQVDNYL